MHPMFSKSFLLLQVENILPALKQQLGLKDKTEDGREKKDKTEDGRERTERGKKP
jgi:hypothetical protein